MTTRIIIILFILVMVAAGSVPAHAFGGPEEQMFLKAYVNTVRAEVYDRECQRGKITGRVKTGGHSANFAKNKEMLTAELMTRLSASTQGDVSLVLKGLADEADKKSVTTFKKINGCFGEEAKHAEKVLDLVSKTEPQFLMKEFGSYVGREAVKAPE